MAKDVASEGLYSLGSPQEGRPLGGVRFAA